VEVLGFNINITTGDAERLIAFYADVVGLPRNEAAGRGAFHAGPAAAIHIDGHSETTGPTKEPQRVLINFFVADLAAERQRLLDRGVTFIREPQREEWGGLITTFLDPDGNYLQLIEFQHQ